MTDKPLDQLLRERLGPIGLGHVLLTATPERANWMASAAPYGTYNCTVVHRPNPLDALYAVLTGPHPVSGYDNPNAKTVDRIARLKEEIDLLRWAIWRWQYRLFPLD